MKKITLFLLASMAIFLSCNFEQEQLFDRDKAPVAPVLTVEGTSNFIITEDLPDFYYTVLTWSRANFGKGVSANYTLSVSDNEEMTGNVKSVELGTDIYLRALSATELYQWAVEDFGVYSDETEQNEPVTLFFRIAAMASVGAVYSNVESMTAQWVEEEVWEPVDLKIYFKVISGDWDEYAVYAWPDDENIYGGWPGLKLEANGDGWYSFTVPTNRPINLIINNNGNGKQFDFLKDPIENAAFEFEIGPDNDCVWTQVEIPFIDPVEFTIDFKVVSGDWGEYAVYAWGESDVYGGWPGLILEPDDDGWYSFTVPTNRPINLIINNNGNGKQFDFLKDPTEGHAYEFEIGPDNNDCVWKVVAGPPKESALYMIGDDFGGWDWSSDGVVTMTPVNGYVGHFWAVRYINAGKGFKWCKVRDWNGDFYSIGEEIGYTVSGGNAYVAESGMYMVYVDMEHGKISVEPAKVFGKGECFGGWLVDPIPFSVTGQTMMCTTITSGELRIYATSDIAPAGVDWWQMEFVVLDGKIVYRGNGGDQERVVVDAGKMVTLDFNAGTGTIE